MKLGLGLYRHMLVRENFQFARQAGATHVVAHWVDYFKGGARNPNDNQPTGTERGWGLAGDPNRLWTVEELAGLRHAVEEEGLKLEAIENLDPAHWHDILLDGPDRSRQIENVKTIIQRMGEAGIPILGYNFSIAGVCGRTHAPYARGRAMSVGMEGPCDTPMPNGMVWNMVYDAAAPPGAVEPVSNSDLWARWERFIEDVLPVAEKSGVRLALHPDDPPMPTMRGQARLVYQPGLYQRVLDFNRSPANSLEFCLGTLAEMPDCDIIETVDRYSAQGRIAYVHCRNVTGKVPRYRETFIDDGDIDVLKALRTLHRNGFDGVIIPDHTPQMSCSAPWHAGMAFALGYLKAALQVVQGESHSPGS
jgi:mannonate dehydratase